jgi:anti-anti-sigma factor
MQRGMAVSTRTVGEIMIVDIVGEIDYGSASALKKTLIESLKTTSYMAISLTAVDHIDSAGIASLLEALKEARDKKKKLVLFGLRGAVLEVLRLTKLTGVFQICENEAQALLLHA